MVSVIVPVYNEAAGIEQFIGRLSELAPLEIIVADGGSSDGTPELSSKHAPVVRSGAGRGIQMNAGARAATGDVLLFLHSDVHLDPGALGLVQAALGDPRVVGGNFQPRFAGNDWVAFLLSWQNVILRRCGVVYGDTGIFCRRSVFEELGGYREWPIMEDYEFARRLRRAGRVIELRSPIHISDRRWKRGGLIRTLCSWLLIQTLYWIGVSPVRLGKLYSHVR
jgi:rSAM/selenodomain-associated transferase 2